MSQINHLGCRAVIHSIVWLYITGGSLLITLIHLFNSSDVHDYLTMDMSSCQWWFFVTSFLVGYCALYYSYKNGGICKGIIIDTMVLSFMHASALWYRKDGNLLMLNLLISMLPLIPRSMMTLSLLLQGKDKLVEIAPECVPFPSPLPDCLTQTSQTGRCYTLRKSVSGSKLLNSKSDLQVCLSTASSKELSSASSDSGLSRDASGSGEATTSLLTKRHSEKSRRSWSLDTKLFTRFCHRKLFTGRLCSGVLSATDSEGSVYIRKNNQGNYCRVALDLRLGALFVLSRVILSYYTGIVVVSYATLRTTTACSILHLVVTVLGIVEAFQMERAPWFMSFFRIN